MFLPNAREGSTPSPPLLAGGDVTSEADSRQRRRQKDSWDVHLRCFDVLSPPGLLDEQRRFPQIQTRPSGLSAGIQQRWNGCLKRIIPWVKTRLTQLQAGLWDRPNGGAAVIGHSVYISIYIFLSFICFCCVIVWAAQRFAVDRL